MDDEVRRRVPELIGERGDGRRIGHVTGQRTYLGAGAAPDGIQAPGHRVGFAGTADQRDLAGTHPGVVLAEFLAEFSGAAGDHHMGGRHGAG
ncbi:Uncharacterised protein [Mycobacteroides abscessus subsp. abscessus]|nr:Uncharacterised protein [Mycobacteroides abscessus subsp. abscessus]